MKKVVLLALLFVSLFANTQTPTNQDCLGAIPICNNSYVEINSPSGTGNYPDETNYFSASGGCHIEEANSIWYSFTVSQSGDLEFVITPNDLYDDYDWMLFNLTDASCGDIYNDPSLVASCNSYGIMWGNQGPTGISTSLGGQGNSNGPGSNNGPPFNAALPVFAGEQYVLLISNYSGSPNGYQIDFMQNSNNAVIFDDVPPTLNSINPVACNDSEINISFSEQVLCSSVELMDFTLIGPSSVIGVIALDNSVCASGGIFGQDFSLSLDQNLLESGDYYLILNNSSGTVEDACGNIALVDTLSFTITELQFDISDLLIQPEVCGQQNGGITGVQIDGGNGSYIVSWSNNGSQLDLVGLAEGNYTLTVSDQSSCPIDTVFNVGAIQGGEIDTSQYQVVPDICGNSVGSITGVQVPVGANCTWYDGSGQIYSGTVTDITGLTAGAYTMIMTDTNNCTDSISVIVPDVNGVLIDTSGMTITSDHCLQGVGAVNGVYVVGGSPPYLYNWMDSSNGIISSSTSGSDIHNLIAGSYTLIVSDENNCMDSSAFQIGNVLGPEIDSTNSIITPDQCYSSVGAINNVQVFGLNPINTIWYDSNDNQIGQSLDVNGLLAGQYFLKVNDAFNCWDSLSFIVPDNGSLVIDTSDMILSPDTCSNSLASITNLNIIGGSPGYIYTWFDAQGFLVSYSTTSINVDSLMGGEDYSLLVVDQNDCTDSIQFTIPNLGFQDSYSIESLNAKCSEENGEIHIDMQTNISGPFSFSIDYGQSQTSSPIINGLSSGQYDLVIQDVYGCEQIETVIINQDNPPAALFFSSESSGMSPLNVQFENNSTDADSFLWMVQDDSISSSVNLDYLFSEEGEFIVTLFAYNGSCVDSMHTIITVSPQMQVYIPNAFTPDQDAFNNYFYPVITGGISDDYQFLVFNRWGDVIFESNNINAKWNGEYQGKLVQDGVYIYRIQVRDSFYNQKVYTGHITVMK